MVRGSDDCTLTSLCWWSGKTIVLKDIRKTCHVALYILDRTVDRESQLRCASVDNTLELFVFDSYFLRISSRLFKPVSRDQRKDYVTEISRKCFRCDM